jgi:hypothetical protein
MGHGANFVSVGHGPWMIKKTQPITSWGYFSLDLEKVCAHANKTSRIFFDSKNNFTVYIMYLGP